MSKQLHLVPRLDEQRPDPVGTDILALASKHSVRVLELFDAPLQAAVTDLTLSERDMPEVAAALHWADEVHVHHVAPAYVLAALPYVRPAVLENTALVLRGPWVVPSRPVIASGTRLERWPGPVRAHRPPSDDVSIGAVADIIELPPTVDRWRASLLSRSCGPVPMQVDDGRRLAVVGLTAALPEAMRDELLHVLPTMGRPEVALEVLDESEISIADRSEIGRALQVRVVPPLDPPNWTRDFVEAVLQGVPIVCVGDPVDGAPEDVVFTRERDAVGRCASFVRSWCAEWAQGGTAPVDRDARIRWLAQQDL